MGFFDLDNLKGKMVDLAQSGVAKSIELAESGVAKSKEIAEIAKLKTANMAEEDNMKRAYIELGKLYYAQYGMCGEGEFVSPCERITAAMAVIETNKDRIADLKADGDDGDIEVEIITEDTVSEFEAVQAEIIVDDVTADDLVDEDIADEAPKAE